MTKEPRNSQPLKADKVAQLCGMINRSTEEQTDLDKLVALSMRTGYELGKQTK